MSQIQSFYENYIKWYFVNIRWQDIVEIIIFAVLLYYIILWIKRSRAWALLKGAAVIFIIYLLAYILKLNNALLVFNGAAPYLVTCLVIIFQAEIRRALEQIGGNRLFEFLSGGSGSKDQMYVSSEAVEAIIRAAFSLGKNRVGALIVIERRIALDDYIATGITLNAEISSPLLIQIFEHNTPLHDGAVIIRNGRIAAATCYLPLSGSKIISKDLGTRHRAGLGISEVSDSLTVIVSEETGNVTLASGGELFIGLDSDGLRQHLSVLCSKPEETGWKRIWKGLRRR